MIVQQYQKMWRYNDWAWEHVFHSLDQISTDEYMKSQPFFWGSLHGLLSHCIAAETIWINRLNGISPKRLLNANDFDSLNTIKVEWKPIQAKWHQYLSNLTDGEANSLCHYTATEGTAQQVKVADIITHAANHATDHRSQMTPVLAQLGKPTTELDYLFFCLSNPE